MTDDYADEAEFEPGEDDCYPPEGTNRPAYIPEKFWDAEGQNVRIEDLANSYAALERKLSAGGPAASQDDWDSDGEYPIDRLPEEPKPYDIDTSHGVFDVNPEIDAVLQEAGFTQEQAQLVYDLAAHVLMPVVSEAENSQSIDAEETRLQQHFGGDERWHEVRRQLRNWGKRHLSDDAYDALSSTYDGVLSLYRLMHAEEPSMLRGESVTDSADETSLRKLIRDPRYWRDRDTALVRRVSDGFRRLYPDGS